MLRIRMRLPGRCFSISMDACSPFISGIAMSMTTTSGSSFFTSVSPSRPLPASPITVMDWSSSRMRRNPCRTSAWSSTSTTRIGCRGLCSANACLLFVLLRCAGRPRGHLQGHRDAHDRSAGRRWRERKLAAHQLRALAHADQADTPPPLPALRFRWQAAPAVFNLELDPILRLAQADPGFGGARVPAHVGERFLDDAVDVDSSLGRHDADWAAFEEVGRDTVLASELLDVPLYRV